jgi:hypothetical protein
MLKRLLRNRKGTAEVIGTIMFIVILLFFFTNVYLWHDAATKDANELYLKKMSSSFSIEQINGNGFVVTADGGSDIVLSRLWIVEAGASGRHLYADLENVRVVAGTNFTINFAGPTAFSTSNPYQVSTGSPQEDSITINYEPGPVKCTVINTLGIAESTTFHP